MKFGDIFKKSFLEGFSTENLSDTHILVVLLVTCILAFYIFYCYRLMTRRTFYSKNFNISLVGMAIITAAVILTIQSSIVVSLGMVGALSIVRFRTAIKDPMDLVFLFWSISIGIICGAGLIEIAVLTSLIVTLALFLLDRLPVAKAPMILVVNGEASKEVDEALEKTVSEFCKYYKVKSRSIANGRLDVVMELRIKDGIEMTNRLAGIQGIASVSLLQHDGEVTF